MISVELKNFGRLQDVANNYPRVAEKHVGYAIVRSLTRVMGTTKKEAPQGVTTFLKNRWSIIPGRFEGALRSGTSYAMAVHNGTQPHFAPIGALQAWARKKGMNAYALRNSIAVKGTKANPFLTRSVKQEEHNIDGEMKDAIKKILSNV